MNHRRCFGLIVALLGLFKGSLQTRVIDTSQSETSSYIETVILQQFPWNICPYGWVHATRENHHNELKGSKKECLFFSTESLSWPEAQRICRESNSFLVTLEAFLSVGDKSFQDVLEERNTFSVWTGLHEEEERLLWDDPAEGKVHALAGFDPSVTESERVWSWNSFSFSKTNSVCGLLQVHQEYPISHDRRRRQISPALSKPSVSRDTTSVAEDIHLNHHSDHRQKETEPFTNIFLDLDMTTQEDKAAERPSTTKTDEASISIAKSENTTVDPVSDDDDEIQNELGKLSTPMQLEPTSLENFTPIPIANHTLYVQTTSFTSSQSSDSQSKTYNVLSSTAKNFVFNGFSWNKLSETTASAGSESKSAKDEVTLNLFRNNFSAFPEEMESYRSDDAKTTLLPMVFIERYQTSVDSDTSAESVENATSMFDFVSSVGDRNASKTLSENFSAELTENSVASQVHSKHHFNDLHDSSRVTEIHYVQVTANDGGNLTTLTPTTSDRGVNQPARREIAEQDSSKKLFVMQNSAIISGGSATVKEHTQIDPPIDRSSGTLIATTTQSVSSSSSDTETTSVAMYDTFYTTTVLLDGGKRTHLSTGYLFSGSYSNFTERFIKNISEDEDTTISAQEGDYWRLALGQATRVHAAIKTNNNIPSSTVQTTHVAETPWSEMSDSKIHITAENVQIITDSNTTVGDSMTSHRAQDSRRVHTGRKARMSLQNCEQKKRFVCASSSIGGLKAVGHCERGWLGHQLLPYCYKPVGIPATYSLAWRQCMQEGAVIVSVRNSFYANITGMLLWTMRRFHGFPSGGVWVNETAIPNNQLNMCGAMRDGKIEWLTCAKSLPYICQKYAKTAGGITTDDINSAGLLKQDIVVENMTSAAPQPLWCPVQTSSHDDLVIWYKDGMPIPAESGSIQWTSTDRRTPGILHLTTDILKRLNYSKRFLQPAMLQGTYWCKVWRPHPLTSVSSYKIFVRFTDVVTVQGFIKSTSIVEETATFFNKLGDTNGLPAVISRDLEKINNEVLKDLQVRYPFLHDIISTVVRIDADKSETEIMTYMCLSRNDLPLPDKGLLVEEYLKSLHVQLLANEEYLHHWNVTFTPEKAFRFTMTEMCSEAKLVDKSTGYEATFPSTPVNQRALSKEYCDGDFLGYAICTGNLRSGSLWGHREIDHSCNASDEALRIKNGNHTDKKLGQVSNKEKSVPRPEKPKPDLLLLDEVHIEPENVADVTNRLERILASADQLNDVDIETVADVIDRIAVVPVLPLDVGKNLVEAVSRVLDSPLPVLQTAQERSGASFRILRDMDQFVEKLDFMQAPYVRYVTSNVAMELWNLRKNSDVIIGFGATTAADGNGPFSESRILTIRNRTWTEIHLSKFDVAIELPDQVVLDPITDTLGMRLSMTIFRNPGLFLSSYQHVGLSASSRDEVNSAVISAKVDGRKIENLVQKVKLFFKPHKISDTGVTRCVFWDFGKPRDGDWSPHGCTYNGTIHGRHICLCNHLTNFAVLLDFYGDSRPVGESNTNALSLITIVGVILSMLGLTGTILTFIIFKKLRKGRAQQTLFNMSIALLCSQAILIAGLKQTNHYGVCLAVAVLLHYFILVSFMWMMVEAVLQYLTFVKVLGTYISKYTLKTLLSAWGVPAIPVVTVLCIDYRQYRGRRDYCWMELEAFYYAFALPAGVIMLFNLVLFSVIMINLMRRPMGSLRCNKSKHRMMETNIKAAFTIFILLGLTWIFGFLAIEDARLPFQYLFTTFSSLQGFLIFVLLIARRRQVREQWKLLFCHLISPVKPKVNLSPSNSSSLSSNFSGSFLSTSGARTTSCTSRSHVTVDR